MPRSPLALLLLGILVLAPAAGARAAATDPVALTRGWQFVPDPTDAGFSADLPSGRTGTAWRDVTVPHVMQPSTEERYFKGSVGWYRTTVTPPADAGGRTGIDWALRFEGVRRSVRVWLNGQEIGRHEDPYTPFELPADGIRPGEPNRLVLRVDNRKGDEPREGWWNWGGVVRPVSLVPRGAVVAQDVGLLPRQDADGRWTVRVDGWLQNRSGDTRAPVLAVRLAAPGSGTASEATSPPRKLRPGERIRIGFDVPVRGDARTWSPDDPALYAATVTTRLGGEAVQVDRERIGLRTVDVRDGMLRLNGKALDLRGASVQEDVPGRGPAMTDADVERIVGDLKALGANVTRAHYLLDERLLDRLDEEGILVWSQAPVYHRDVALQTSEGRVFELDVVRHTILQARNHPSVITHSVANELDPEPDQATTTGRWLRSAAGLAKDLDPGLPVSVDLLSYPGIEAQRAYADFDALGLNSYYGWYDGKADRSTADLGDLENYLRSMHAKYPSKALVMTEFGAEASLKGPANVKQTYAFQEEYLKRNLDVVDRMGFMGGAIYWTAREFAVKPRWDGGAHPERRDSIHKKALIAYDGTRKPAWQAAHDAFRATPLYRDDPRSVARAELESARNVVGSSALVAGVFGLLSVLLAFYGWCLRDIWRASRPDPPQADVVALRRAA